jgi:hypothetical protein
MITHSHLGTKRMDIFSSRGPRNSERTNEIKAQVATELGLDAEATVMVSELACMEEGCPPVETIIAIFPVSSASPYGRDYSARHRGDVCAASQFIFGGKSWKLLLLTKTPAYR